MKTRKFTKLNLFVVFLCVWMGAAQSLYAQKSITLSASNQTIVNVFHQVEQSGDYVFLFDENVRPSLLRRVDIDARQWTIDAVMKHLLRGTNLKYKVSQRQVLVFLANSSASDELPAAQRFLAEGVVYDENREEMMNANIFVMDAEVGTVTDSKGHFSIRVPSPESKLRISFVGYEVLEVTALQARKGVFMKPMLNGLSEVKVVADGYNRIDKRLSASSTFTIKPEDFMIQNTPTLSNMLQGVVPGLSVVAPSGSPNAAPRMRIRGSSTIHGDAI